MGKGKKGKGSGGKFQWDKSVTPLRNRGPFKHYPVGGCQISLKKRYKDVWCNVISVARGRVGVKFPKKERY